MGFFNKKKITGISMFVRILKNALKKLSERTWSLCLLLWYITLVDDGYQEPITDTWSYDRLGRRRATWPTSFVDKEFLICVSLWEGTVTCYTIYSNCKNLKWNTLSGIATRSRAHTYPRASANADCLMKVPPGARDSHLHCPVTLLQLKWRGVELN